MAQAASALPKKPAKADVAAVFEVLHELVERVAIGERSRDRSKRGGRATQAPHHLPPFVGSAHCGQHPVGSQPWQCGMAVAAQDVPTAERGAKQTMWRQRFERKPFALVKYRGVSV